MMAQPLETVQRDEDPVYGPLGRAGAKIQRGLTADTEITSDMADQLANGSKCTILTFCREEALTRK